jgi:hypothetical protein
MQDSMLLFFLPILRHSKELELSAALDERLGDLAGLQNDRQRYRRFQGSNPEDCMQPMLKECFA